MPLIIRQTLSFLATIFLAFQSYSQTKEEQVLKLLNDTLRKDPKNSELLFMRGLIFSEEKKYDSAIANFTDALKNLKSQNNKPIFRDEMQVDTVDILMMRAYCYDVTNSIENSVADYRYLQTAKPNDFMYSISIARLYFKHKDFESAQNEIDQLKKFNENERGLVYQAVLFYEMNQYEEALNAVEVALKKYPGSIEGLVTKAKILGKLNKTEEACKNISEAKSKITLDYFGGQRGYYRDFESDIDNLKRIYCQ